MATPAEAETLLADLDQAPDGASVARAEGLLGRLVAARAERTRARLASEANAERLARLEALAGEIGAAHVDAERLHDLLQTATDALAALLKAVDERGRLHDAWRARLRAEQVPAGATGRAEDAGLSWLESGGEVIFDGQRIGRPDAGQLAGLVIHQAVATAGVNPELRSGHPLAEHCEPFQRALVDDPAGYLRSQFGAPDRP
ncbi:hypothetical protein FF36_01885 [Frankia torreyi]|uniref:Uncharacterized protein n=1 Tax=Frankia torreyi TaxID=1856 RepID=A0A0D8BI20_9ACTN|nr:MULTISPECIES: hypothetical protein [Frankia]KJE23700.1 hypothetical protein FF36_01885 [Frankia torreyi]KQM05688.1 hypothetical protein FF86_1014106 [Frankia sp. CpI1-P]